MVRHVPHKQEDVMKIKLLRSTVVDGVAYEAGAVIQDASKKNGTYVVNIGKAVELKDNSREIATDKKAERRETR